MFWHVWPKLKPPIVSGHNCIAWWFMVYCLYHVSLISRAQTLRLDGVEMLWFGRENRNIRRDSNLHIQKSVTGAWQTARWENAPEVFDSKQCSFFLFFFLIRFSYITKQLRWLICFGRRAVCTCFFDDFFFPKYFSCVKWQAGSVAQVHTVWRKRWPPERLLDVRSRFCQRKETKNGREKEKEKKWRLLLLCHIGFFFISLEWKVCLVFAPSITGPGGCANK